MIMGNRLREDADVTPSPLAGDTRPSTARRQQRWDEIVAAAERIFLRKGYAATTVRDIADEVGVQNGSLYYYIETKEDLLYEILRDMHEQGRETMERVSRLEMGPLHKIGLLTKAHARQALGNRARWIIYFHDFRALGPGRVEALNAQRDAYESAFRELIRAAQRDGLACPDTDPRTAGAAILGMVNSLHLWYSGAGRDSAAALSQQIADLAVASIACDADSHTPGHRTRQATLPSPGTGEP